MHVLSVAFQLLGAVVVENLPIYGIYRPDKLDHIMLYGAHLPCSGFELTTLVVIGIENHKCSLTRKGYNGMPLHVMEQPPRFFALAYRVSDACIYQ
jgi:hypothetical protein